MPSPTPHDERMAHSIRERLPRRGELQYRILRFLISAGGLRKFNKNMICQVSDARLHLLLSLFSIGAFVGEEKSHEFRADLHGLKRAQWHLNKPWFSATNIAAMPA